MLILHFYNHQPASLPFLSIFGINQAAREHYLIRGVSEMAVHRLLKIHQPPTIPRERTLLNSPSKVTLVAAVQLQKTSSSQVKRQILLLPPTFALAKRSIFKIIRALPLFPPYGVLAMALYPLK